MAALRQEANVANANVLVKNMHEFCFRSCVQAPAHSVGKKEEACLQQCMLKYISAWNLIGQEYQKQVQQRQSQL